MKYLPLILLLVISLVGFSQSPDAFKYQGVVHSNGHAVGDQDVSVRVNILSGSVSGAVIYSEQHTVKTGGNGTFNLEIGNGTAATGIFSTIDWGSSSYFVNIELDIDNDNVFENVGTSQLLSVPYALYANKSGSAVWEKSGNDISYSNGAVGIGTDSPAETLHINGNIRGNQNGALRINTVNGYLDVGPKNADFAHFYTNMPYGFYFGGNVTVREHLIGYKDADLHLSTESNSTFQPEKRISILNSNGYVGISKTNPEYLLDVNGTVNATSYLLNGQPLSSGGGLWSLSGSNAYYNDGNVGIGTDSPAETLHINGNIRGNQNGALRINTVNGYLDVGPKNADFAHFYTNMPYGFYFGGNVTVREHLIGYKDADLHLSTESNSTFQPEKRISILNSNGYVGISKTNPEYLLDVNGTVNASSYLLNGVPLASGGGVWSLSGPSAYYNGGNVGIGTDSPAETLHINGNIRGNQNGALRINTVNGYLDVGPKNADFAHFYTNMPYGFYFGGNVTVREHLIGYKDADLHLSTESTIDFQPVKRISILNSNGYVGIGTIDPKAQLQVENGDVYLSNVGSGVIMKSPNGQCWRLTVSDSGVPVFTSITCP